MGRGWVGRVMGGWGGADGATVLFFKFNYILLYHFNTSLFMPSWAQSDLTAASDLAGSLSPCWAHFLKQELTRSRLSTKNITQPYKKVKGILKNTNNILTIYPNISNVYNIYKINTKHQAAAGPAQARLGICLEII